MVTLQEAIEVYKMNRAYVMLAGINNVVCLFNKSGRKLNRQVCKYIIYGNHQNRIVTTVNVKKFKKTIIACYNELTASPSIISMSFKSFEDLYDEVNKRIGKLPHIGPLTIYDAALRLGFILSKPIYPKNKVYIQAGAYKGIKNLQDYNKRLCLSLFPVPIMGAGPKDISTFARAFNNLPSMFIEDFLCVYDDKLDKLDKLSREDLLKGMQYHRTSRVIKSCYRYSF